MRNKIAVFNEFDSEDFKVYGNHLLLQRFAGRLDEKEELTLEDLENLMRNKLPVFNDSDSEEFQADLKRLLLKRLKEILAEKGELTLEDLEDAYEKWSMLVRLFRLVRKKMRFLNSIDHNVYVQLRDFVISFHVSILSDERFEN